MLVIIGVMFVAGNPTSHVVTHAKMHGREAVVHSHWQDSPRKGIGECSHSTMDRRVETKSPRGRVLPNGGTKLRIELPTRLGNKYS